MCLSRFPSSLSLRTASHHKSGFWASHLSASTLSMLCVVTLGAPHCNQDFAWPGVRYWWVFEDPALQTQFRGLLEQRKDSQAGCSKENWLVVSQLSSGIFWRDPVILPLLVMPSFWRGTQPRISPCCLRITCCRQNRERLLPAAWQGRFDHSDKIGVEMERKGPFFAPCRQVLPSPRLRMSGIWGRCTWFWSLYAAVDLLLMGHILVSRLEWTETKK